MSTCLRGRAHIPDVPDLTSEGLLRAQTAVGVSPALPSPTEAGGDPGGQRPPRAPACVLGSARDVLLAVRDRGSPSDGPERVQWPSWCLAARPDTCRLASPGGEETSEAGLREERGAQKSQCSDLSGEEAEAGGAQELKAIV